MIKTGALIALLISSGLTHATTRPSSESLSTEWATMRSFYAGSQAHPVQVLSIDMPGVALYGNTHECLRDDDIDSMLSEGERGAVHIHCFLMKGFNAFSTRYSTVYSSRVLAQGVQFLTGDAA